MRNLLLSFITLLTICSPAFTYEIVLKNGKKVSGELITQTDQLLTLQDSEGVRMNFKTSLIDFQQTQLANEAIKKLEYEKAAETAKKDTRIQEPVEKKPAKRYTKEDIKDLPELSEFEDFQFDLGRSPTTTDYQKLEKEWTTEARILVRQLDDARAGLLYCEASRPDYGQSWVINQGGNPSYPTGPTQEQIAEIARHEAECREAEAAYRRAQADYDAFLQHAKEQNALPGWVEADRVR